MSDHQSLLRPLVAPPLAEVSFRDKEARVTFEPTQVTIDQLVEVVNRSGFRAALKRGS